MKIPITISSAEETGSVIELTARQMADLPSLAQLSELASRVNLGHHGVFLLTR